MRADAFAAAFATPLICCCFFMLLTLMLMRSYVIFIIYALRYAYTYRNIALLLRDAFSC